MTLMAQATPALDSFWFWIVTLASIAGNVAMVLALRHSKRETRRIEPQPFDVRLISELAREHECVKRSEVLQKQIDDLWVQRKEDDRTASIHRKSIYDEIGKVRDSLSAKIDDMPARLVALLRNTGAIGKH